jgi:hypothetical protein
MDTETQQGQGTCSPSNKRFNGILLMRIGSVDAIDGRLRGGTVKTKMRQLLLLLLL